MKIHPTALVSKKAHLGEDVEVGPFTIIGNTVVIGRGTKIGPAVVIEGNTTVGEGCEIFTGAIIGSRPQDSKYKGEKSYLQIGNGNIIREYCTFNPGTTEESKTVVGDNNLFMAYCHVAHDCQVGSYNVIANNGTLAGHVTIEDKAVIGGVVAVHQIVRVGTLSIIGGCSKVVQDIPPYSTCDGHPARVYGLNLVGLRRNSIPKDRIENLDRAFKILFGSGLTKQHAIERAETELKLGPEVLSLLEFVRTSQRGISRSCNLR
jgi:UDP-N-acetylglucosamine acyltransferase